MPNFKETQGEGHVKVIGWSWNLTVWFGPGYSQLHQNALSL